MQMPFKESVIAMTMLTFAAFGAYLGASSWSGTVFVSDGMYLPPERMRTPAAIRKTLDISNLEGDALTSALQSRLLSDMKVYKEDGRVGIELGHFVTRDDQGERVFGCSYFSRIEMHFVADGVIEGGERPAFTVEGPCNYSSNVNRIDPIWIPYARVLQERPSDLQLTINQDQALQLRFSNMGMSWPKTWSLYSIRMFDPERGNREVNITETEMRQRLSRLTSINFSER